jgi:hypothetical protein
MRGGLIALAIATLVLCGCQFVDSIDGPQRLVSDLQSVGLAARIGSDQDASLLGGEATTVCVGNESISVYTFDDAGAASEAASTVNRRDPFQVGNAIVEWIGPPRFWIRDRVIVLYVGGDPAVDAALRSILGQPFAESPNEGRALPRFNALPCR